VLIYVCSVQVSVQLPCHTYNEWITIFKYVPSLYGEVNCGELHVNAYHRGAVLAHKCGENVVLCFCSDVTDDWVTVHCPARYWKMLHHIKIRVAEILRDSLPYITHDAVWVSKSAIKLQCEEDISLVDKYRLEDWMHKYWNMATTPANLCHRYYNILTHKPLADLCHTIARCNN
jgi:hypothetical protein